MKQLWAPWRMVYIDRGADESGCIFCDNFRQSDWREALVLAQTPHTGVMLNKYPYNNGHLLVAPKRHEKDLSSLSNEEYVDLNETLRRSVDIIRRALKPGGINIGMNLGKCAGAGVEDHLHWHIVPRWEGDTNFMPVLSDTRVMPQHLADSYDRLRSFFENLLP
ncbi:MAG TPA: HIT domain-containing protein [candidate division Zixibacteria bacterium]|nr:HIT domain-containing protein [candidate division Zixibacteria bacterium]